MDGLLFTRVEAMSGEEIGSENQIGDATRVDEPVSFLFE